MLPHSQATSTDHAWPKTSDISIEKRRRNHFITAPLVLGDVLLWIFVFKLGENKKVEVFLKLFKNKVISLA